MSKNDPTGKIHSTVTKTSSQKSGRGMLQADKTGGSDSGDTELKPASSFLGGLRGVLADRPSNQSNSTTVGGGGGARNQSSRPGTSGNAPHWTKNSGSTNFGA